MFRRKFLLPVHVVLVFMLLPSMAFGDSRTSSTFGLAPFDPFTHRSNFIVTDLDRALRIYRDILGFQVNVVLPVQEEEFMRSIFGLPDEAEMRIAFLSGAKGEFGHIGITEVTGVNLDRSAGGPYPSVLILEVHRELEPLHEAIAAESSDVSEIFDLEMPSRREFMFTDHDGHRVLLMKLKTDSKKTQ
jgi:catechol 2,3-dioxygenase-like lactoylglutathione lyase family enzyme